MLEQKDNIVEIKVDAALIQQLVAIITPMGLSPEALIQRLYEWISNPETRNEAVAWILNSKEE